MTSTTTTTGTEIDTISTDDRPVHYWVSDIHRAPADNVDVLDLRDDSDHGVCIAWNRHTGAVVVQIVGARGRVLFERRCEDVDGRDMYDLMVTPRSVAWAVRDDEDEYGATRVNFSDGYAEVPGVGLVMCLDLEHEDSNEKIRCTFIVNPRGDDRGFETSFVVSRHYLMGATQPLEYLVL